MNLHLRYYGLFHKKPFPCIKFFHFVWSMCVSLSNKCLLGSPKGEKKKLRSSSFASFTNFFAKYFSLANFESLQVDRIPPSSDNGYFDYVPREAMLQIFQVTLRFFLFSHFVWFYEKNIPIFQYLDFHSLIRCGQVSRLFRHVSRDPLLYMKLKLKPWFNIICDSTLIFLLQKALYMKYLDLSWCGKFFLNK